MTERVFIFDCRNNIVGNKAGYRTMRGAMQQADSPKSKVHRILWKTYQEWQSVHKNPNLNLVYSVKTMRQDKESGLYTL